MLLETYGKTIPAIVRMESGKTDDDAEFEAGALADAKHLRWADTDLIDIPLAD